MEAKRINVNTTAMSYYDEGQGEAIVLVHGFCGSKDYWEKIIPALTGEYRVIAIDLPGHGDSDMLPEEMSIEGMAEVIKEAIGQLGLEKVSLFGHSLGGYVTLAFAEAYEDLLNRFSLVHSTANPDSDEAKKGREAAAEKVDAEGLASFIDGLVPKLFAPGKQHAGEMKRAKEIGYRTNPEGAKAALEAMKQRPDRSQILKNTKLPVLIVAGENDQIIPADKSFTIEGPNIQHAIIKDAGHMSMYESSEELVKLLYLFMRR